MARRKPLKPRKKPAQSRSRFTVEQILEAATQVFEERGYAGGTTNHIAERAGVSIGSIYQYFPNKDSILTALLEIHVRSTASKLDELAKRAVSERWTLDVMLERMVRSTIEIHTSSPRLHHVLLHEAPRVESIHELMHGIEDRMAETIEELLRGSLGLHVRHAQHAAYIIVHVVDSLAHEFVLHPPPHLNEEAFISEVVCLIRGYLLEPCPVASEGG